MTWTLQKSKESKTASDGSGPVPNETPLETDTTKEVFESTPEELEKAHLPKISKRIESDVLSEEPGKNSVESKVDFFMSGSSHIRSVLIGVEYRNCCWNLDVYLHFVKYLDGANSIKTDLYICNLRTGQFESYKSLI